MGRLSEDRAPRCVRWIRRLLVCTLLFAVSGTVGCKDEIVVVSRFSGSLSSGEYAIAEDGKLTARKVSVTPDKPGKIAPGESIVCDGKRYLAGSKGGILSIRDGQLVLRGMKEVDL
jgi:hypothetical protein